MKTLVIVRKPLRMEMVDRFTVYAVDFEGSLATGILEYGLVGIDSVDGIFSAETAFCKNRGRILDAEYAHHHISAQQVAKNADFTNIVPRFLELRTKCFFCAHNAAFENALLNSYCPVVLNAYSIGSGVQSSWEPWLDTYGLYKKYFKKTFRKSIASCSPKSAVSVGACEAGEEKSFRQQTSSVSQSYRSHGLPSGNLQTLIDGCRLQGVLDDLSDRFCPASRRHYHGALYDALACALLFLNFIRSEETQTKTLPKLLQESASEAASEALQQPTLFDP